MRYFLATVGCKGCTKDSNSCHLLLLNIRCYDENEDLFAEALAKDLRKPRQEAVMFEVPNIGEN